MDNKTYHFTLLTISPCQTSHLDHAKKNYCSQELNHLGYVKPHGFHDNPYINLKHGQYFFYNFSLISYVENYARSQSPNHFSMISKYYKHADFSSNLHMC